jgi:FkbM family methyltransferase
MLTRKAAGFRMYTRSVFKRVFHWLLDRIGIRRFKEHSFFATLLPRPATVADFGAHRGEFFAALKSEHPVSRALLVEANPALAEFLQESYGNEADVVHAAVVGENEGETITFTRSSEPEASSIFKEWAAGHGVADQVEVPAIDLPEALRRLGGRIDLAKLDVEGAEVGVLEAVPASDLAGCGQLTVEFHDKRPPLTQRDTDRVCERMRSAGYALVNANWPYFNDILFVNLRSMAAGRRLGFRCRVAIANTLFIARRILFGNSQFLKRTGDLT